MPFFCRGLEPFRLKFSASARMLLFGLSRAAVPRLDLPPRGTLVSRDNKVGSVTPLCLLFRVLSAEMVLFTCSDFLLKTGMNAGALLLCKQRFLLPTCVFSLLSSSKCSCAALRGQEGFLSWKDPDWGQAAENKPDPCWPTAGCTLCSAAVDRGM